MPYKDKDKQRSAQRKWAKNNREVVSRNSHISRKRNAALVEEYKNRPCTDCGVKYPPYVMDLDHLPGFEKKDNVAKLVSTGASKQRVLDEMAKCEVVCSNCHRIRTYTRDNS